MEEDRWDEDQLFLNETWLPLNCSGCKNELCIEEEDYEAYKSWISIDNFEMVLIALNIIVFLAGIMGNLLVRYISLKMNIFKNSTT